MSLWVKSEHRDRFAECPLYPRKQTLRWVLDMIESVGKMLKLLEHHHEISP